MQQHPPLHIAVAGLGTVGSSVVNILENNSAEIEMRAGRQLVVKKIAARNPDKTRNFNRGDKQWCSTPQDITSDIDVLIECIGGSDGFAYDLVKHALQNGTSVVTANKALLAVHGRELAILADKNNAHLKYEAAVAGAIPVMKSLREGLAANHIHCIYGILNGTCNYILTEMRNTGESFDKILKDAQDKGYAEADPTFDIDGIDTAHKTALLAAAAFNIPPHFDQIKTKGIRQVTDTDIHYAEDLGYRIKLLGVARSTSLGIEQSVEPCLVDADTPLAAIDGSLNAVYTETSFAHETLMVGRGAGGDPTASAIVADVVDIARGVYVPAFGVHHENWANAKMADMSQAEKAVYIRLIVEDRSGVLADISKILSDAGISIQSALQLSEIKQGIVPLVLTTHVSKADTLDSAIDKLGRLKPVKEPPFVMRIVDQE